MRTSEIIAISQEASIWDELNESFADNLRVQMIHFKSCHDPLSCAWCFVSDEIRRTLGLQRAWAWFEHSWNITSFHQEHEMEYKIAILVSDIWLDRRKCNSISIDFLIDLSLSSLGCSYMRYERRCLWDKLRVKIIMSSVHRAMKVSESYLKDNTFSKNWRQYLRISSRV